ncbi:hypothetical protein PAMP_001001 [Pampus punctatissimus]
MVLVNSSHFPLCLPDTEYVWKLLLLKPASRLLWLTDGGENSEGLDGEESKSQARQMEITSAAPDKA